MKKINKKGNASLTIPIMIIISTIIIISISFCLYQVIIKFINYEKINTVALKYMFVIEKFGYLTYSEKEKLIDELIESGFEKEKIFVSAPNYPKEAGELIEFKIEYNDEFKIPKIININTNNIPISIIVRKSTFSKK